MVLGVLDVLDRDAVAVAGALVSEARRGVARGHFALALACLDYADARREVERADWQLAGRSRSGPGETAADELAVLLRQQPWPVRCLVARSRRIRARLPAVWEAFGRGELDADQVVMVDRIARRATTGETLVAIDDAAVEAAQTRAPKQLGAWLLRLLVQLEPEAFAQRHRRALADRRVTVAQGPDGIGYVTGEMTAADAAAIDASLSAAARSLGSADPRTEQQRRADILTDLLLGRLRLVDHDGDTESDGGTENLDDPASTARAPAAAGEWVEVEDIDLDTGELLGTRRQRVDDAGYAMNEPIEPMDQREQREQRELCDPPLRVVRHPRTTRIGVVVPLPSLLALSEAPGELVDRSGVVPAVAIRDAITDALGRGDQVLFTRLLTDDGGRLLDLTELGRFPSRRLAEAVRIRAGTCSHPTCTVPADRCDLDHREPHPRGPTAAANLDPRCRRHHRGKTFAWLTAIRDGDTLTWTMPDDTTYRVRDDPLPTG